MIHFRRRRVKRTLGTTTIDTLHLFTFNLRRTKFLALPGPHRLPHPHWHHELILDLFLPHFVQKPLKRANLLLPLLLF